MRTLAIDLETYSELDIAKVGLYKYAENCKILLCAYAYDNEPVQIVDLAQGEKLPLTFLEALYDKNVVKTAYNAAFEIQVLTKYLNRPLDSLQWQCTMVQALSLGLPGSLERVGKVLNIAGDKKKLEIGKKLIKFFSMPKPQQKSKKSQGAMLFEFSLFGEIGEENRNMPKDNPEEWAEFKTYCKQDVEAERAIRKCLEKYQPPGIERRLWQLDQTINSNGVWVDMELVENAIKVAEKIKEEARLKGEEITGGLNIGSNLQLSQWIEKELGQKIASLDKASRALLKEGKLSLRVLKVLRLKEVLSKTSTKKYDAMQETTCADHRARGMFQFCGASRTGRWSGRLIQLQNLPQNKIKDLETARQFVRRGNSDAVQIFYDEPIDVLSQLIRTAFVAVPGSRLIIADFSAIEARILSYLADEEWRMEVFANGGDIYCASASEMFKVPVEKHGVNHELRKQGKIAELACGYGGGVQALKAFGADKMGLNDEEMSNIIKKWRATNPRICEFWRIIENSAKKAVRTSQKVYCKKGISFDCRDNFLFVNLPSGRAISYYKPNVEWDEFKNQTYLTYEGTVSSDGSWGKNYTWGGKLVENIVQAIARDCLGAAMLKLNAAGYKIVMHIHDEVVIEMPEGEGSLEEVLNIMGQPLNWASGLKLTADGYESKYYKKD